MKEGPPTYNPENAKPLPNVETETNTDSESVAEERVSPTPGDQIEEKKEEIDRLNRAVQTSAVSLEDAEPRVLQLEDEIHNLEKGQLMGATQADKHPEEDAEDVEKESRAGGEESKLESDDFDESNPTATEAVSATYLDLKRDFKEKKRAFEEALENRSGLRKVFRLGRKHLGPEEQVLYDKSLEAEKAYYQSFAETQKDKIEARLNRNKTPDAEELSVAPLLVQRHITKPERDRLESQKAHLPPRLQAILDTVKNNKITAAALLTAGLGMKGISIASSFGVGLAAGAGTRWGLNKLITAKQKRLDQKVQTFNDVFESGDIDSLADIKDEYFQELRQIDNRKLAANLTAAGVAVTAGASFHGSELQADTGDFIGEQAGEYWDTAKEKISGWFDGNEAESVTRDEVETSHSEENNATVEEVRTEADPDAEHLSQVLDKIRDRIAESRLENNTNILEAERLAKEIGIEIEGPLHFRMEGGVITEIEGQPVPESYFSEADKANIDAARQIGNMMSGDGSPQDMDGALDGVNEALDTQLSTSETNPSEVAATVEQPQHSPVEGEQVNRPESGATEEFMGPSTPEPIITQDSPEFVGPPAPETIETKFTALLQEVSEAKYDVQPGDNVWDIIEHTLESNGLFQDLEAGQKLHLIDELKDRVVAMSPTELEKFGISSGNPDLINVGEQLDLSKLFDQDTLREAMGHAENLSASEIASIEANTPDMSEAGANEVGAADAATTATPTDAVSANNEGGAVVSEARPMEDLAAGVPDYSGGGEQSPGEVTGEELREQLGENGEIQNEALSNVPRQTTTEEVMAKQEEIKNNLQEGVRIVGGLPDASQLIAIDAAIGYEPLYTPELLERTLEIASPPGDMNLNHLYGLISEQMFHAYQGGEIDLPVQWVYLMDMLADGPKEADTTVIEEVIDRDADKLNFLASQAQTDIRLPELSSAQIQELGVSSGNFEELRQGDKIKVGEIIKLMMQNMADRINEAAPPTDVNVTPTSSVTTT